MAPRLHTIESLRLTLQKLEHTREAQYSPEAFAELKRIVLNRVAELELAETLQAESPDSVESLPPAESAVPIVSSDIPMDDRPASSECAGNPAKLE